MDTKELYKEKSSTNDFLVSKSDNTVCCEPGSCIDTEFLEEIYGSNIENEDTFDSVNRFIEELPFFNVVSLSFDSGLSDPECEKQLLDLASVIDKAVKSKGGIWWFQKEKIFSMVIPSNNKAAGIKTAKDIKAGLTEKRCETLSAGIASYPEIHFERYETVENSVKALEHSYFYEGDAIVSFDSVSLNISGDKYYQEGRIDEAVIEFENAIKLSSNYVNVRNSLGICYGIKSRLDEALKEFDEAISLDPNETMAIHNKGLIYSMKGESKKAKEYFKRADSLSPDIFEIKFHLGKLYFDEKNYDKSIEHLSEAVQLKESSMALYCLASSLSEKKQFEDAVKYCKKAVKLSPDMSDAISLLGELFFEIKENIDIVLLFAREAVLLDPENGLYRKRLGKILHSDKKSSEALMEFEEAQSLGEDVSEFINLLKLKSA